MGEKGEGFTGTIIKDIWTITRGDRNGGGRWGGLGWWGGVGKKDRKLYLNNNKKIKKKKKERKIPFLFLVSWALFIKRSSEEMIYQEKF